MLSAGNKGIGYAICQSLAAQSSPPLTVLLGSRDEQRGAQAVDSLRREQPQADVRPLAIDIADEASVERAAERVRKEFGGLDVLVQNAGIASKGSALDEKIARDTLRTNYWGSPQLHYTTRHCRCALTVDAAAVHRSR